MKRYSALLKTWFLTGVGTLLSVAFAAGNYAGEYTPERLRQDLTGAGDPTQEVIGKVGCTLFGAFVTQDNFRFLFGLLLVVMAIMVAAAYTQTRPTAEVPLVRVPVVIAAFFPAAVLVFWVYAKVMGC